jgi:Domain of unknown function (DUF1413)
MEEKIPITVRLPKSEVTSLDHMARVGAVSRQVLIEGIIAEAISTFGPLTDAERTALPPTVVRAVESAIKRMKAGDEISLKKLVGKEVWATLDDPVKRMLGKVFKVLVADNEFQGLTLGRKKSNNEQQYNKT